MQGLQMRLPGSNGNWFLISSITTPYTLRAGYMIKEGKKGKREQGMKQKLKSILVNQYKSWLFLYHSLHWYMPEGWKNTFIISPGGCQACSSGISRIKPPRSLVWGNNRKAQRSQQYMEWKHRYHYGRSGFCSSWKHFLLTLLKRLVL